MCRVSESQRDVSTFAAAPAREEQSHATHTVLVDVLEVDVAVFAVEGAVRPADLEQGADSPPRAGPAVGARARHRRQGKTARAGGVTPLRHSAFVSVPGRRSK